MQIVILIVLLLLVFVAPPVCLALRRIAPVMMKKRQVDPERAAIWRGFAAARGLELQAVPVRFDQRCGLRITGTVRGHRIGVMVDENVWVREGYEKTFVHCSAPVPLPLVVHCHGADVEELSFGTFGTVWEETGDPLLDRVLRISAAPHGQGPSVLAGLPVQALAWMSPRVGHLKFSYVRGRIEIHWAGAELREHVLDAAISAAIAAAERSPRTRGG